MQRGLGGGGMTVDTVEKAIKLISDSKNIEEYRESLISVLTSIDNPSPDITQEQFKMITEAVFRKKKELGVE